MLYILKMATRKHIKKPKNNKRKKYGGTKAKKSRSKEIKIYFFNATWCPHCIAAKPGWQKFSARFNNSEMNGYRICCLDVETTNTDAKTLALVEKFKVDGIPIVIGLNGSKQQTLDTTITYDSLEMFMNKLG